MPDRIDAFAAIDRTWDGLEGDVLSSVPDAELQAIVEELTRELSMPIGLVSLVLRREQVFRAQVGLGGDVGQLRATDRDASFCQFVVRDGKRFEVADAPRDARVPQLLVKALGIRSYIGQPVTVRGAVIGSLCAIGTAERTFTDAERARIEELAKRASARLDELARRATRVPLSAVSAAMQPALAELNNVVSPIVSGVTSARVASAELEVAMRAPATGLPEWASAARLAMTDLVEVLSDMDESAARMRRLVSVVQAAIGDAARATTVDESLCLAVEIAEHHVRHVGGVRVRGSSKAVLREPIGMAVNASAIVLSGLGSALHAARQTGGIDVTISDDPARVRVVFACAAPVAAVQKVGAQLGQLMSSVEREVLAEGLQLRFTRVL